MKKNLTIFIAFICFSACEQTTKSVDPDKEKLNNVCDKFMKDFQEGKTSDALQLLKRNSIMAVSTVDTLEVTIRNQLDQILPAYGKMISSEFIVEKNIKDFISQRIYILRFEKFYLQFQFILYKTNSGWTITNFNYKEDLIDVLY
jgi:hypothetical protein